MQYFDLVLSLSALFGLCAWFTLCTRLHSALSPLVSLSCISIWFTLAGIFDVLVPSGWIGYLLCYGLGVFALAKHWKQKKNLVSPASLVFWGLAIGFSIYFAIRQPMFSEFDEFSFWGPAAQMTKTTGHLYTIGETGVPWQVTQNPGLIVLGYFVQFFGQFAPFKVYLGYDILLFACIAALVGVVGFKNYKLAVPVAVIGWCVPWFFTTYARTIFVSKVYMSAYGDIPAGMLAGGVAALWMVLRTEKNIGPRWAIFPVLALLANIKDNTFPVALVIAGLIAADHFLFDYSEQWKQGWYKRFGFSVCCMAAPVANYMVWSRYIGVLVQQNAASGGTGETSLSPISAAIYGTKMLLGIQVPETYEQRRELFYNAMADMKDAFAHTVFSMIGSGMVVVALILILFVAALVLAKNSYQRCRVAVWMGLSILGYAAYSYVIALSYGFIFKPFQAESLTDYNRYMYTYYIAWFMIALAVLVWVVQKGRWNWLGSAGVLALGCLMLLRVNMMVLPQMSVLGFSDATFADQHLMMSRAQAIKEQVQSDSRIFIVSQGDDGTQWFTYSCYLQPNVLDYSGWDQVVEADGTKKYGAGGGTFGLPEHQPQDETSSEAMYYHAYTKDEFAQAVHQSGCDYIFVDKLDDGFVQAYGELFTDQLQQALAGETILYHITANGYEPVTMEVPK